MTPYAIVPGEVELGVQKRCPRCGEFWPAMDDDFWPPIHRRGRQEFHSWCKACCYEARREREAAHRAARRAVA